MSIIHGERRRGAVRQKLSAEARRILSELADRPLEEIDIAKEEGGRPFLPGRELDFSITHSGSLAAVSFVKGGFLRTGCDVEQVRPRVNIEEIAKTFFSASERKYIFPRGGLDETRFYRIWTLKECLLKLRGLSVFDMAGLPSFISGESLESVNDMFAFGQAVSSPLSFSLYELSDNADKRYMLAAAIEGTDQGPPEIRWFSQSFLPCKKIAEIKAALNPAETVRPKI
jgi:4'-phosphopantetheinyl transferase